MLIWICVSSLVYYLFKSSDPYTLKKPSGCLFIIKLQEFLIYSGFKSFLRCMHDKYFLPGCGLTFHFNRAYVLNFNVIYFIHFCLLWVLLFQIPSKKSLLMPRSQRYSVMFFSWTFKSFSFYILVYDPFCMFGFNFTFLGKTFPSCQAGLDSSSYTLFKWL